MENQDYRCKVQDCDKQFIAKGYCKFHWQRMYRTGSATKPNRMAFAALHSLKLEYGLDYEFI